MIPAPSHQVNPSHFTLFGWSSRHCRAGIGHPYCALFEFLTHRIHECGRLCLPKMTTTKLPMLDALLLWLSSYRVVGSRSLPLNLDRLSTALSVEYRRNAALWILRLGYKMPCSFCLGLVLSRCSLLGFFHSKSSRHAKRHSGHMGRSHVGAVVSHSSWVQLLNHPSPGSRYVNK